MPILLKPIVASLTVLAELSAPAGPVVSPEAIRTAVSAELREGPKEEIVNREPGRFSAAGMSERARQLQVFEVRMQQAEMPHCLRPDGLKHQPTNFGIIGFGGLLALPFIPVAALRGKCRMK